MLTLWSQKKESKAAHEDTYRYYLPKNPSKTLDKLDDIKISQYLRNTN